MNYRFGNIDAVKSVWNTVNNFFVRKGRIAFAFLLTFFFVSKINAQIHALNEKPFNAENSSIYSYAFSNSFNEIARENKKSIVADNKSAFSIITCPATPYVVCLTTGNTYNHTSNIFDPTTDCSGFSSIGYTSSGAGVSPATGTTLNGAVFNVGTTTITWTATDNCGATLNCTLTVTIYAPLSITMNPVSQTDCDGNSVLFSVAISGGTPPITYTWQRKRPSDGTFTNIVGDPNVSYPLPGQILVTTGGVNNPDQTQYQVIVTDPCYSVTSLPATLTLNALPNNASGGFTNSDPSNSVCLESSGTFTFDAINSSFTTPYTITYDILNSSSIVVGSGSAIIPTFNSETFTVNDVPTIAGTYTYKLTSITNGNGCVRTSSFGDATALITVRPLPNNVSYTTGGFVGNSFCVSGGQGTLTFDADNTNFNSGSIQYTDGTTTWSQTISSASATTFNVAVNPSGAGNHNYSLVSITNEFGCTRTFADGFGDTTARITINQLPTTPDAGTDQSNCNNGSFTLAGNNPSIGNGVWSVVSGTATITTPTSATSTITGIP
ncbi:MAG: HYR domain-containing protein, partial [Bacteroidia bacterium]|nr:HYR domain-containing protein [Bacteroidia bacterium]